MRSFDCRSSIFRNVELIGVRHIAIGSCSNINSGSILDGRGGLTIGNNVDIARQVNIWSAQHDYNSPTYKCILKPVVIEDYVWLATRSTILPGVHIGKGAVVASGAVVTKDVPELAIVAGVPAKIIGYRDSNALKYRLGNRYWFE